MLFSPMKATLKFLIERIESLFVDSIMIELDLNDHKSEFTKVVVLSMCHIYPSIYQTYTLYKLMYFENKIYFLQCDIGGSIILRIPVLSRQDKNFNLLLNDPDI